jgi:hypothetical protein
MTWEFALLVGDAVRDHGSIPARISDTACLGMIFPPPRPSVKDLPHHARRSITFDRGSEFMNWPHLQAEIGTQT